MNLKQRTQKGQKRKKKSILFYCGSGLLRACRLLRREIASTGINSLDKFKAAHPEIYEGHIYSAAAFFEEEEVLVYPHSTIPDLSRL
ncbi:MAG: hypothetical protein U0176_17040 [Bacteroidia bacterium]